MPEQSWYWEVHTVITLHTSVVHFWDFVEPAVQVNGIKSQCGSCMTEVWGRWNSLRRPCISFIFKSSSKMVPDHMVHCHLTLLINETNVFMRYWRVCLLHTHPSFWPLILNYMVPLKNETLSEDPVQTMEEQVTLAYCKLPYMRWGMIYKTYILY